MGPHIPDPACGVVPGHPRRSPTAVRQQTRHLTSLDGLLQAGGRHGEIDLASWQGLSDLPGLCRASVTSRQTPSGATVRSRRMWCRWLAQVLVAELAGGEYGELCAEIGQVRIASDQVIGAARDERRENEIVSPVFGHFRDYAGKLDNFRDVAEFGEEPPQLLVRQGDPLANLRVVQRCADLLQRRPPTGRSHPPLSQPALHRARSAPPRCRCARMRTITRSAPLIGLPQPARCPL